MKCCAQQPLVLSLSKDAGAGLAGFDKLSLSGPGSNQL